MCRAGVQRHHLHLQGWGCRCRWGSGALLAFGRGVALASAELRLLPAWALQTPEEHEQHAGGHAGCGCWVVVERRGPEGRTSHCPLRRQALEEWEQLPVERNGRCGGQEVLQPVAWWVQSSQVEMPARPLQAEHLGFWRGALPPPPVHLGLSV